MYRSPVYDDYYTLLTNPARRNLVEMPRGSFKSTALCASVARWIVLDPNVRILYASETYANSKKYLMWVRRQFEANEEFKAIFGNLVSDRGWKEEEITIRGRTDFSKKEPTLTCAGIDVTKTGMHYDIIVVDDPVSLTNCRTRDAIESVIEWYKMLLSIAEDVVDANGQVTSSTIVILNGTPYEDTDLYAHVQNVNKDLLKLSAAGDNTVKPYRVFIKPAETSDGKLMFQHLTREILNQRKTEQGSRTFSSQYLLDPVPSEISLFKRPHFRVLPHYEIPPVVDLNCYLLTDTATSEDREDDTVLAVMAKDVLNNAYILDMLLGQWAPSEVIKNIASLYLKWNCRKVLMEKISTNEIYGAMLEALSRETQQRIRVEPVFGRTTESKQMRIQSLQGRLEAGKLYFSSALNQELIRVENGLCYGKIVEEFLRFAPGRKAQHDDIPDCLSDMDKQDSRGAPLCPAPKLTRAKPAPQNINGQMRPTQMPRHVTPTGSFWSGLANKMGR